MEKEIEDILKEYKENKIRKKTEFKIEQTIESILDFNKCIQLLETEDGKEPHIVEGDYGCSGTYIIYSDGSRVTIECDMNKLPEYVYKPGRFSKNYKYGFFGLFKRQEIDPDLTFLENIQYIRSETLKYYKNKLEKSIIELKELKEKSDFIKNAHLLS